MRIVILIHQTFQTDLEITFRMLGEELVKKYNTGIAIGKRSILINKDITHRQIDIIGRCGDVRRCSGLRPDFWYSDRKDTHLIGQGSELVNGIELDSVKRVLKIVDILAKEGE